jgi:hypothetical protein
MKSKYTLLIVLALVVIAFAAFGLTVLNQPQTGGSSAANYSVAGDPNYAVAVVSTTTAPFTLGGITQATSAKTFAVNVLRGLSYGLKLGDTCQVQLSSASSSNGWSGDAQITSIANQTSTATVTFFNGTSTATSVATGTLTLACQNY